MEPVRINIKNLEKILAIFNFLWAGLLIFSSFQFIYAPTLWAGNVSPGETFWKLSLDFHWLILLGLLSLVAACLLFFNKRAGWMCSVIAAFSNTVLLIFITTFLYNVAKKDYLIPLGLTVFHLTGFIFLLLKKVRASHNITPKYLWITIGLLAIFMVDLIWSDLF